MTGVGTHGGGLTQSLAGAPGAEGLLELLARGDQLRADAGLEAKRAPAPPPAPVVVAAEDTDLADAAAAELEQAPKDEDEEREQGAAAIDLTKANAATDRNVAPAVGKTYGALRELARTDERELTAEEVPVASPTGARLVTKPDGKKGVAEYADGMTYDADGWHRPGRAASPPPPAPAAASIPPDLPAAPAPVAEADEAATRQARDAQIPKETPGGSARVRTFTDGSAVYADGSVYDPDTRSIRKGRDTTGTKDALADLLVRATTNEGTADVGTQLETKGVGADGAWDFDASALLGDAGAMFADAEDGFAEVGGLAYKEVGAQVIDVDKRRGIVTTLVSVTGIPDRVKDVIEAGAYGKTLAERKPRGVWSHKWEEPISKTLEIRELPPGDPDLPATMKGPGGVDVPWPAEAGALKVKTQFNLLGARGQQAFADVVFFDDEQQWSIGYQVPKGGARIDSKTGLRHIHDLELYEYSPVLFGAMPHAVTLSVKSAQTAFRALEAIRPDELAAEDDLRLAAGLETKAVRRAYVRDEDGKFAEVPGGGRTGNAIRAVAAMGEAQGKPKLSPGDRRSYLPYGKTTPETVTVESDDGDTIAIVRPNGGRTFVTADQLKPVDTGGAFDSGSSGGGGTPSGAPAVSETEMDSWKVGPSGLPTRVLPDGTELRKTSRAGQQPAIAVLNPGGKTRGRMAQVLMGADKGKWIVSNATQRLGTTGTVESALELLTRRGSAGPSLQSFPGSKAEGVLPRNDEVGELQQKVADLEALVRQLAGYEEVDEVDPDLLLERKADGFAACGQCGSTNADAYADGTGRCEDCGWPLAETKARHYVRDGDGQFAETPGGGGGALKPPNDYASHFSGFDSLEDAGHDGSDFADVAVWELESATQAAYNDAGGRGKMPAKVRKAIEQDVDPYDGAFTLATRNSDDADFHDLSKGTVRSAIRVAQRAGAAAAGKRGTKTVPFDGSQLAGVVEVPVHQHLAVAADEPASPGAPAELGDPHAITEDDDASLDLVADDLARDDDPPPLAVDDGTVVDGVEVKYDTSPVGDPGGQQNWVDKAGGLPTFVRAIAHALIREGKTKSTAIAIAVSRIKAWAGGGGDVSTATRAKATKALAEWESMKAGKSAVPAELQQKALVPVGEFELLTARRLALEVE